MSNAAQNLAGSRITQLLDENSFVEIGAKITARSTDFNMPEADAPSDGVITGYGVIGGNLVYVFAQDPAVLGGTVGEMHARKIAAVYDMAMKMGAPVIGLIDSAGLRLQESTDALDAFGRIYLKQSLASGVIPQIMAVFGPCGGGLTVMTGLADFTFMESEKAKLFINSPNALEGNRAELCDTAAAAYRAENGTVDFTGSADEIFAGIRQLVDILPSNNEDDVPYDECDDDLNRVCEGLEGFAGDPAAVLAQISDSGFFCETKAAWAKDTVTGFIKLNGLTVGAVANRSALYGEDGSVKEEFGGLMSAHGADKAAAFVNFCDAFDIPVLTLTNVRGFKACKCTEKRGAKAAAALTAAFANATVPKVNVITGEAFGSTGVIMNSKSLGADMTFAWESAKIGMMDASIAAQIMYPQADGKETAEQSAKYDELQQSVLAAAKRGYIDTIIEAADTRKYVIGAFEMLYSKRETRPSKKHGTV